MAVSKHDILALAKKLEPSVAKAFIDSINDITSEAQLGLIYGHLASGDVTAAIAALHLRAEFLAPLDDAVRRTYLQGGIDALAGLPRFVDPRVRGLWYASTVAPRALKHGYESNPPD